MDMGKILLELYTRQIRCARADREGEEEGRGSRWYNV